MRKKKKWLVTVQCCDPATGHDSTRICSKVIELNVLEFPTPVEWFLSKPKTYFDFDFELSITALLNYWAIK